MHSGEKVSFFGSLYNPDCQILAYLFQYLTNFASAPWFDGLLALYCMDIDFFQCFCVLMSKEEKWNQNLYLIIYKRGWVKLIFQFTDFPYVFLRFPDFPFFRFSGKYENLRKTSGTSRKPQEPQETSGKPWEPEENLRLMPRGA